MATRCFMPWLRLSTNRSLNVLAPAVSSTSSIRFARAFRGMPNAAPKKSRYSRTAHVVVGAERVRHVADQPLDLARGRRRSRRPATVAVPLVGRARPTRILIVVVLPAPFGPMKPRICPRPTDSVSRSRARNRPYFFVSSCVSTTGPSVPISPRPSGPVGPSLACRILTQDTIALSGRPPNYVEPEGIDGPIPDAFATGFPNGQIQV